jgi:hypothetical protein
MTNTFFHNFKLNEKKLDKKRLSHSHNISKDRNVDINKLLNRVKIDEANEKKQNFFFFSLGIFILSFMVFFVSVIR